LSYVSLDTGVIVEYIDLGGNFHRQAEAIIESVLARKLLAVIAHPILAETYYVSLRVYEKLGMEKPEDRAEKLVGWLYKSPNFAIAEPSLELALLAGRIKTSLRFALTDAYVIAASKLYKGRAVFRRRESEIEEKLAELTKDYRIVFLEDYSMTESTYPSSNEVKKRRPKLETSSAEAVRKMKDEREARISEFKQRY
jgi:predicted nucleic acid-binding protein